MFQKMSKKKRILLVVLAAVVLLLLLNVSIGIASFSDAGAAMSVSFDKLLMLAVDRVQISTKYQTVEITDPALVNEIVDETAVATHVHVGCPEDREIRLYCGDWIVRTMKWSTCCDAVHVYDADIGHWIFCIEGAEEEGFVYLSPDLLEKLDELIIG